MVRRPWARLRLGRLRSGRRWDGRLRVWQWWRNQGPSMGSHADGQSLPVAVRTCDERKHPPACSGSRAARWHFNMERAGPQLTGWRQATQDPGLQPQNARPSCPLSLWPRHPHWLFTSGVLCGSLACGTAQWGSGSSTRPDSPSHSPHCSLPSAVPTIPECSGCCWCRKERREAETHSLLSKGPSLWEIRWIQGHLAQSSTGHAKCMGQNSFWDPGT